MRCSGDLKDLVTLVALQQKIMLCITVKLLDVRLVD